MKPCATCAEKSIECSYESQYLRGRPPTPPSSTPEASNHGDQTSNEAGPPVPSTSDSNDNNKTQPPSLTHQRSSPEPGTSDIHGQYVDPTSGLSFLQRAQSRLGRQNLDGSSSLSEWWNQPLTAAGDKPLVSMPHDGSNTGYHSMHTDLPAGTNAVELMDLCFDVCISTYKPLHRPTVEIWYRIATTNLASGYSMAQGLGHAEVSILLSIFAIATFHRQKSRGYADDISSLSESDTYFRRSLSFTESETGVATLESAQARILQTFYLLTTCRQNQAWYVFGSLLQIISALGMHRRDWKRTTGPQPDYIHSQCRKRLFWSAYILDRNLGVVMGRPRHFHDDDIDQELPDCVNDSEMSPAGRLSAEGSEDCHMDAFVCNIKLARVVGKISHGLYPIKPLSETSRIEVTRSLGKELEGWQSSLPPFLSTVRPSSLVRSFRRQCIALRLAYDHAVMHLYRPFLLSRRNRKPSSDNDVTEAFRAESIQLCIAAAQDALRTIDAFASDGPQFHAFWWTHYITFCALTVVYVWNTQQPSNELKGIDRSKLMMIAEQCQIHLAQATASNSPCRRYSIILEELRSESRKESSSSLDDQTPQIHHPDPSTRMDPQNLRVGAIGSPAINTAVSLPYTSPHLAQTPVSVNSSLSVETRNPFMNWQTSDWLEIDASVSGSRACSADMDARVVATSADHACHQAYGMIPGYSLNPNVQWYGGGGGGGGQ
jgi:hypothetical protein